MRVLLDESLPRGLAEHLPGHEVTTVPLRGWAALRNGELLALASSEFDVFITADQGLEHQQDLRRYSIAVVILAARSNRLPDLLPGVPRILEVLPGMRPGRFLRIAVPPANER